MFIHACHPPTGKSKEAEIKRINKELANIRSKFKGDKTLDGYQKKKYVCKLLFIFLLGHDIDFGHMEAVNLLSSNKYTEKQIVSVMLPAKEKAMFACGQGCCILNAGNYILRDIDSSNKYTGKQVTSFEYLTVEGRVVMQAGLLCLSDMIVAGHHVLIEIVTPNKSTETGPKLGLSDRKRAVLSCRQENCVFWIQFTQEIMFKEVTQRKCGDLS